MATIEQKAIAYDKAIEKIKYAMEHGLQPVLNKEDLLDIFPELAESDDEKIISAIRKAIEAKVENLGNGVTRTACLAWLEKQGQTFTKKDIDDAYLKGVCDAKIELEKQGEQNHCMIQWKGDNLKEVIDFTGKDKNFEKWFKSFEEYEKYVQEHNGIFKLFNADGSHYEVPVGAWIVKTPDGYNVASKAIFRQKSVDTPKFKVGDWVVFNNKHQSIYQVEKIEDGYYILRHTHGETFSVCVLHDESLRLWTIQDAKNGDVLAVTMYPEGTWIGIFKEQNGCTFSSYCFVNTKGIFKRGAYNHGNGTAVHPATKEQREQLEKAMADAGYAFDFDKKELKKIEDEEYDGDDYGIDSLWHAKNILERTLGKVDGYQSDDGILEHKCAISAVDRLYKHSIAWSEEDEHWMQKVIDFMNHPDLIKATPTLAKDTINWLKSLKDRIDTLDSNALIL